jgi:hypothetical protein
MISSGGEGLVTLEGNTNFTFSATLASQLGIYDMQITLTDPNLKSSSEKIQVKVINDPPIFAVGAPKT